LKEWCDELTIDESETNTTTADVTCDVDQITISSDMDDYFSYLVCTLINS